MTDGGATRDLEDAAEQLRAAKTRLIVVMRQARADGWSYRDIAERVGLSHETVRTMILRRSE